jgi:hypothetical protein
MTAIARFAGSIVNGFNPGACASGFTLTRAPRADLPAGGYDAQSPSADSLFR